ncbi:hypothetical protein [Marinicauda pacifica]|uniref:hypothetical protein n=1 Tax=Marinicauda pacifica TaxID=1133559 RepID=UPI0035C86F04
MKLMKIAISVGALLISALPGAVAQSTSESELPQRYFVTVQTASRTIEANMVQAHQCLMLAILGQPEAATTPELARHAIATDILSSRIVQLLYFGQAIPAAYDWLAPALAGGGDASDQAARIRDAMPDAMRSVLFENAGAQFGVENVRSQILADCRRRISALPRGQQIIFDEFESFLVEQLEQ